MKINVKEARSRLSSLLDQVEEGDEVILFRHDKAVARLVPSEGDQCRLPNLKEFRASIPIRGRPLSRLVLQERERERF